MICVRLDCGVEFESKRLTQIYCSPRCRRIVSDRRLRQSDKRIASNEKHSRSEKRKDSQRGYQQTEKAKATQKKWNQSGRGQISIQETKTKYRVQNLDKTRAQNAVNNAKGAGKLSSPTICSKCDSLKNVIYHHPDITYRIENDLVVIPMCVSCHHKEHIKLRGLE